MSDTAARLLQLLSLLQRRDRWSGPDLAAHLGVTARTVRRDVERLRGLGYPVEAAPGTVGGYRLGAGAVLPPLLLDDDEATAIAVTLGVAAGGAVPGLEEPVLAALTKLERVLPAALRARVDAVRATTALVGPTDVVPAGVLVALARASAERIRIRLAYVDRHGTASDRRVDPFRLVSTGRRWYLVAFDVDRNAWRTLRVDRMATVEETGHRFRRDDPPDPAELVICATGVAPYRWAAVVVVRAPTDVVAARVPATVGLVEAHPDGSLLTVGSDDLGGLAGHLVGLSLPFEVLEPPELRALLVRIGAALVDAHHGPSGTDDQAKDRRGER